MTTNKDKYNARFSAAGLLYNEFIALQELLVTENFIDLLKVETKENKYLGIATFEGRKRVSQEIKKRYLNAPDEFWSHFFNWSIAEQKLALFFLILKTYRIVFDIHWDVTRNKFLTGSGLDLYDLTMKFDELSSTNETVASWSEYTIYKLKTRYKRVLTEVGILKDGTLFKPVNISQQFWDYFNEVTEAWFLEACFKKN